MLIHSVGKWKHEVVDATRISDNKLVWIKYVGKSTNKFALSKIASSSTFAENPHNHCTPILDTFVDPSDDTMCYLVEPFLRQMNEPPIETVSEVIDFVDQTLQVNLIHISTSNSFSHHHNQGLAFLHSNGITLRSVPLILATLYQQISNCRDPQKHLG